MARTEQRRNDFLDTETHIRFLENKFGRAGRFPAYPEYGVSVPYEDRVPHLADRLGKYGLTTSTNKIKDWLSIQHSSDHPSWQSYFVQKPTTEPDEDVDFEYGEVIYENTDI